MPQPPLSRRRFLKTSGAVAGAVAGTAAVTETARAGAPRAQAAGAGERLNIGLIGTGGRCRHLVRSLAGVANVRVTAACDIYRPHLDLTLKSLPGKVETTADFHALLGRKDVDAVLIASPDHWHVPMTVAALQAGKHVYVEKPVTHSLEEGRTLLDAVARHRRVVQIGTQQRSMPHIARAREMIRKGEIGRVHKIHLSWNRNTDRVRRGPQNVDRKLLDWKAFLGNARKQDFDDYRFRNWRWFWDFGGGIFTDLMVHWIDVAHWILELDHPQRAVSMGGHFTSRGVWETPDTVQTILTYPNDIQAHFEGTFCNARHGAMIVFMGTEGSIYIDRGRTELIPEPRSKRKPFDMILGKGPRGRDFYETPDGELLHLRDWVDAIRNGREPSAPPAAGVSSAAAAHLANRAMRGNGVAEWGK